MMARDRQTQVRAVWTWLPAFRAVAETEHLPTAARRVGVSPPALSRTLGLLESHLGVPLFRRVGRRLELAPAGELLLRSVRDAMRRVHDGLEQVAGVEARGAVFIAASGLATGYVVKALDRLGREHPELSPSLRNIGAGAVAQPMLAGRLDVAFQSAPLEVPGLEATLLGHEPTSIWCGRSHPLSGREDVSLEEICRHPFVAPPPNAVGQSVEGWPAHLKRTVALRVDRMLIGASICTQGALLAVLPDVTARVFGDQLWRLDIEVTPLVPIYAVQRASLGERPARVSTVVDAVRSVMR